MNESDPKGCHLIAGVGGGWRATLPVVNAEIAAAKRHVFGTAVESPHVAGTGDSPEEALTNAFAELGRAYFAWEQDKESK